MFRFIFLTTLTIAANSILGQRAIEKDYPKTLWASNDSFAVKFSNDPNFVPSFRISERDTTDMGTDGATDLSAMIFFGKDSVRIAYQNLPLDQVNWFNIQSPKGKTLYRLHFNRINSAFSQDYIKQNTNKILVDLPEVYELANIIWTLSPSGQRANNLYKQGAYYEKVKQYFKTYLAHPIFKRLDFSENDYMEKYYDFRENSFAFRFTKSNKLVWGQPYFYVVGNDKNFNSLFKQLLPLI